MSHFDCHELFSRDVDRSLGHDAAEVWWVVGLQNHTNLNIDPRHTKFLLLRPIIYLPIFVRSLAASQTPHSNLRKDINTGRREKKLLSQNEIKSTVWSHEAEAIAKPAGATEI